MNSPLPRPPIRSKPALQNDDMPINTAIHIPSAPYFGTNAKLSANAPRSSNTSVPTNIVPVSRAIPLSSGAATASCITVLLFRLIFFPARRRKPKTNVINPTPPVWIRRSMTICPNNDQCAFVSTGMSPVTHEADTVTNIASINEVISPLFDDIGSISNIVPTIIIPRKPSTSNRAGVIRILCNIHPSFYAAKLRY